MAEEDNVRKLPWVHSIKTGSDWWKSIVGLLAIVVISMLTIVPWALGIAVLAKALLGVEI